MKRITRNRSGKSKNTTGFTCKPNGGEQMKYTKSNAVFSECRKYRYSLVREWDTKKPKLGIVMRNPSNADEINDDRTIHICVQLAEKFGFGGIIVTNLFAYIAKNFDKLRTVPDPVASENNEHISTMLKGVDKVLCGWGDDRAFRGQAAKVASFLAERTNLYCLGTTSKGAPRHPSRVALKAEMVDYTPDFQQAIRSSIKEEV